MPLSASVSLKLDRAHEHADSLENLILAWGNPKPQRFVTEVDDDTDPDYVHLRYLVRISSPLPSNTLSQILGDCINNYRAVLEHLIWELSVFHSGPNPPSPQRIKFPSRLSGTGSGGLHAVSSVVVTEVQWLHANCASKNPGDLPPFHMLCELSNVDKHSTIHVVYHYAKDVKITTNPVIIGTCAEIVHDASPLKDGTVIARIAVPRPLWTPEQMEVHAVTEHGIVIAQTSRTPLAHLGLTMEGIKDAVETATQRLGNLLR